MKRSSSFLLAITLAGFSHSQNLIPNGDFESYTSLPSSGGQYSLSTGWTNCNGGGSPDYFHLNGSGNVQLPNVFSASVNPHGGSAIMGMAIYYQPTNDFREYLSYQLSSPMVVGEDYLLSLYVTNGQPPIYYGGMGCDNFSAVFSTSPLVQNATTPINRTPQFKYSGILYNSDWQHIEFRFTADSAYEHITFGNFVVDAMLQLQTFVGASTSPGAIYYLDDIDLSVDINSGVNNFHTNSSPVNVFPNPCVDLLNITVNESKWYEMVLFDAAARELRRQSFFGSTTIDTRTLNKGFYLYQVRDVSGIVQAGRLSKK